MRFFQHGLKRLIIIGMNDLAVEATRWCVDAGIEVRVVSGERFRDLPAFCHEDGRPRSCDDRIRQFGVAVEYWERLTVDRLRPWICEDCAAFSFDSPFIIRQDVIDLFGGRVFNEHGANLPQGRGGGGFTWRMLEADMRGYVVFHLLVDRIDAGALAHKRAFTFDASCRKPADMMRRQLQETVADLPPFLQRLAANDEFEVREQDERLATYFPRLSTRDQALIDWTWPIADIERFVLAFSDPYPGARTWTHGAECVITDCYALRDRVDAHPFKVGIVFNMRDGQPMVCGTDGTLVITEYRLDDAARLTVGDRLFTPPDKLSQAWSRRALYGPAGLKWKG